MSNEKELIDGAQSAVGAGDQILAAGWFEPWSRQYMDAGVGGVMAGGHSTGSLLLDGAFAAASAVGASREMHKSGNMPAAVVLAVSKSKVYGFEGSIAMSTGKVGSLWKTWDLADVNVHAHKTLYVVSVTIEESGPDGHSYHLVGSKLHVGSCKSVMKALIDT